MSGGVSEVVKHFTVCLKENVRQDKGGSCQSQIYGPNRFTQLVFNFCLSMSSTSSITTMNNISQDNNVVVLRYGEEEYHLDTSTICNTCRFGWLQCDCYLGCMACKERRKLCFCWQLMERCKIQDYICPVCDYYIANRRCECYNRIRKCKWCVVSLEICRNGECLHALPYRYDPNAQCLVEIFKNGERCEDELGAAEVKTNHSMEGMPCSKYDGDKMETSSLKNPNSFDMEDGRINR